MKKSNWFTELTGIENETEQSVREFIVRKEKYGYFELPLTGQRIVYGKLDMPSLEYLRRYTRRPHQRGKLKFEIIEADVTDLLNNYGNKNATFQVASQFNLLEMPTYNAIPEDGIGKYQYDHTQGPACAIACGAGTIYRNYFMPLNGRTGQSRYNQVDCLEELGAYMENKKHGLWKMKNGYALLTDKGARYINYLVPRLSDRQRECLKDRIKVGIQYNTEVTTSKNRHRVTQVFCSALPVSYNNEVNPRKQGVFARLILEAAYEATLYAAVNNMVITGNNRVYLTLLGGGAFGNSAQWISLAILKAIDKFRNTPLDVNLVTFQEVDLPILKLADEIK